MPSLAIVNHPGAPLPVPNGWYAVAFGAELKPNALLTRTLGGHEIVLFRTKDGVVAAVDAYCPHLGAHLGQHGTVIGDSLRCSMHGFCFDTEGRCISTPYGKRIPPRARGRSWPVVERNGFVLVFLDRQGLEPEWEVPELATAGWGRLAWTCFRFRGHPQEVSENSADLGHFQTVHGYEDAEMEIIPSTGPSFHTSVRTVRPRGLLSKRARLRLHFDAHVHGLGFSYVDVSLPDLGLTTQAFVLPTPTTAGQLELRIAVRIREDFSPRKIHPLLVMLPRAVLKRVVLAIGLRNYANDVLQDVAFWSTKAYMPRPGLAEGDGPIGRYRSWARQFYADATHVEMEPAQEIQAAIPA